MTAQGTATQEPATSVHSDEDRVQSLVRRRMPAWTLVCGSLVVVCVVAGVVGRVWWLTNKPFNSDAAVVGLMAQANLHGHVTAFFWGQDYGAIEPFLVAVTVGIFGSNGFSLVVVPALLMAATALVAWRVARRLVEDRWLAAMAGALVWVVPTLGRTNTIEYGFRNVTLLLGVMVLLFALRVLDERRRFVDAVALGLAAGLGWWASPEIVYFLVPALALSLGAILSSWKTCGARFWLTRIGAALAAAALGALPWLWSNIPDGFRSLNSATETTKGDGDFLSHLHVFIIDGLPVQFGLRGFVGSIAVVHGTAGTIVEVVAYTIVIASVVLCLTRPGRAQAIALGIIVFPFLLAINPLTWYWLDGRYSVYLPPLLAFAVAIGCERAANLFRRRAGARPAHRRSRSARWNPGARFATIAVTILALTVSSMGFASIVTNADPRIPSGDPNGPTLQVIQQLERGHADVGFANYWVGYKLDYLSDGRLSFSPGAWELVRSASIYRQASTASHPAWLFVPPSRLALAGLQFDTYNVQTGFEPEAIFLASLRALHDPYRVVHTDFIDAVIPLYPVAPGQVGIGHRPKP